LIVALGVGAAVCGLMAATIASLDTKTQMIAIGVAGLGTGLLLVRDRSLALLGILVFGIQFLFYKALGPLNNLIDGGAPGVYVSTADVLVLILYGMWIRSGTFVSDLRSAGRSTPMLVPLLLFPLLLPSFVMAEDVGLAIAELVRMAFGLALYVYIAARVRSRRELAVILVGLGSIAVVQCLVVILQLKSGSNAGLALLGQGEFGVRVAEGFEIVRPSGTLFYPTVLGVVLGSISVVGLSLALRLRRPLWRTAGLATFVCGLVPIVISQARAALIAEAIMAAILTLVALRRGRLPLRVLWVGLAAVMLVSLPLYDRISRAVESNVGTDHFWTEIEARGELNVVAFDIIRANPILGVGLNNYQVVMERYEPYGVSFPGFPVHNLYLLTWGETGIVGLIGLLATFFVLIRTSVRLAGASDRLLASIGGGVAAVVGLVMLESLAGYTYRHVHAPSCSGSWLV